MAYTDEDYKNASQIAYLNFEAHRNLLEDTGKEPTIRNFILADYANEFEKYGLDPNDSSTGNIKKFMDKCDDKDLKIKLEAFCDNEDVLDWKLVKSVNNNKDSGFCASIIETGEGEAIVAFRGSESMFKYESLNKDWVNQDFKLLIQEELTAQQLDANAFLDENKDILSSYNNIDVTGHSLGGELATHFTIECANSNKEIFEKINRCVNLDGPGHNQEYYSLYDSDILKEVGAKTTYYKWSGVSGCLGAVPGSKVINIEINESKEFFSDIFDILLGRHSLNFPKVENGNFVVAKTGEKIKVDEHDGIIEIGEADSVSKIFSGLTSLLDMTDGLSIILWENLAWFVNDLLEEGKDGKVQIAKKDILFLIKNVPHILELVKVVLFLAIAVLISAPGIYLWEKYFKDNVYNIIDQLKEIYTDGANYLDDIRKKFSNWYNSNYEDLNKAINSGYSYAVENPYIKVNTDSLREYGYQLSNINARLIRVDGMIKSLYTRVGFNDLFRLIKYDFYTGFDLKINQCKNYLINTAEDFEQVENNIINSYGK